MPDGVLVVGWLILVVVAWAIIPTWWRSGTVGDVFFSDHINRTHVPLAVFMSAGVIGALLGKAQERGMISDVFAQVSAVLVGAFVLISFLVALTIYLFNWPKILVPPRMRNQRGRLSKK